MIFSMLTIRKNPRKRPKIAKTPKRPRVKRSKRLI
jgi:hypothetical protein